MSSRGSNGGVSIPAGSRKMVQSLKEIVNCPEPEIYAMLKECNMDPNEAVNRLLSQDTFHEVKSKREKRKENKDTTESRPRGVSSNAGRGSRGAADRYVGRGAVESTKPASGYRKENGSNASYLTSTPGVSGSNINKRTTTISDAAMNESKKPPPAADGVSAVSHLSPGYQSTWGGVPGQVSMADIVKMGRPQSKVPSVPSGASHQNVQFSDEVHREPGDYPVQHRSTDEEWPLIEQPSVASHPSVSEPPANLELHPDPPANMSYDRINHQSEMEEVQGTDENVVENIDSPPSRKLQEDNAGGASLYENDIYRYQNQNHNFHHQQVEDVSISISSVAANLQQLNVEDDRGLAPEEDGPSVVIPDHLQVQTADCSHLSFGSFGSGICGSFSGPLASAPVNTSLEEAPKDVDASSIGHLGSRAPEYYDDESLRNAASESSLYHRNANSASQPESLKAEINEHGNQYSYPSSAAGYTFESAQQLSAAFSQPQTSSQMQNLAPFSNVMTFTSSLQSTLLAANVHTGRESDISYSPFSTTQGIAAKYGNSVSSIGGSTISVPESLKNAGFASAQPTEQQGHAGTSVTTGPAVPQHLAVHPYSQPTLPLGPFANMISYPFMPQSYTYMPSAFQQPFAAGNSTYHQSLAAVLPQYKNSVSVSSLPQSASIASGYGGFGNTTSIPANFPMNPPAAPGTNLSYDDVLSSQYKDTNHLMSLQQSENSAMWLHGPGSRTMSALPANTYYGFQGQNQHSGGFRQAQQPLQNHGSLGYPNFYHSQTAGISLEHQQQNPRDGSLGGSQGQPKQSQQQLWQNSY